jgi:hypothetical protein
MDTKSKFFLSLRSLASNMPRDTRFDIVKYFFMAHAQLLRRSRWRVLWFEANSGEIPSQQINQT